MIGKAKSSDLYLVDFGISKRYKNKEEKHIPLKLDVPFCGNIVFASKNAFSSLGMLFNLFIKYKFQSKVEEMISFP